MTKNNGNLNPLLLSRRRLLGRGFSTSLGLGILPHLFSQPGETLLLSQLMDATSQTTSTHAPIDVTIYFTPKFNQTELLVAQLTQALPDARNAKGCRHAEVYVTSEKNQVVLFKGWDNPTAQANYLRWEQDSGKLSELLLLVEGDPRVEYWDLPGAAQIQGNEIY